MAQTKTVVTYFGVSGYHTLKETVATQTSATTDLKAGTIMARSTETASLGKLIQFTDVATQIPIGILGETIPVADLKAGDVISYIITEGEVAAESLYLGTSPSNVLSLNAMLTLSKMTLRDSLRANGIIITQ